MESEPGSGPVATVSMDSVGWLCRMPHLVPKINDQLLLFSLVPWAEGNGVSDPYPGHSADPNIRDH